MSETDKFEGLQDGESRENDVYTGSYVSESSDDIYTTPEVVEVADVIEETETVSVVTDTHGLFSGNHADSQNPYGNQNGNYDEQPPYMNPTGNYGMQSPYGNQNQRGSYGVQSPYGNQNQQGGYDGQVPYGNQNQQGGYDGQVPYGNQNQQGGYDGQVPYGNQNQQGGYGGQVPYGNQNQQGGYGGQVPYGNQNGGYGIQPAYGSQNQSGNDAQSPYGKQNQGGNGDAQSSYGNPAGSYGVQPPYGSQQAGGGYGGQPPFGGQPPYDNPYSPYAMPQKKQNTGLLIGIVIGIIVLFLVAVFALASRAVDLLSEKEKEDLRRDVYDFDDDYDYNYHDDDYDDDLDYDYKYEYDYSDFFSDDDFYADDYSDDAEYDDRYYDLHDEIRTDLSYQVRMEDFEYETDYDNTIILANIPVVSGEDVPNLDKINKDIRKEVDEMTALFESEYESHISESEENYFVATLAGYVAYMDEDKLSIAWQEEMYSDRDSGVYLRSINVDMKNGVILDNEDILAIDDEFSVEFRQKSDEQNGEISYLTYMTDQQITDYFKSDDIIVFYTPKGMEIGFNYEEGWVTVTYEEYEKYLKVF